MNSITININDLITYSGWILTALGFLFAIYQYYKMKKSARRDQEQLSSFIADANYISFEHELLDKIAYKLEDPEMMRYLVSNHQRGCDLYRALVDFYLSKEEKFNYQDLERICATSLINYKWQEDCWKERIALRPENKKRKVPVESFLRDDKRNRTKAYEKIEQSRRAGIEPIKSLIVKP